MLIPITKIEAVASHIAGTSVNVVCVTQAQMDVEPTLVQDKRSQVRGYVIFDNGVPQHTIYLRKRYCDDIKQMDTPHNPNMQVNQYDGVSPKDIGYGPMADREDGDAIGTVVHEAEHIGLASQNEAKVECTAYRFRAAAARMWGLAPWKVKRLYWGLKISHFDTPAVPYRTEC